MSKKTIMLYGVPWVTAVLIALGFLYSPTYPEGLQLGFSLSKWWLWVDAGVSAAVFLVAIAIILGVDKDSPAKKSAAVLSSSRMIALLAFRAVSVLVAVQGQKSEDPLLLLAALVACEAWIFFLKAGWLLRKL